VVEGRVGARRERREAHGRAVGRGQRHERHRAAQPRAQDGEGVDARALTQVEKDDVGGPRRRHREGPVEVGGRRRPEARGLKRRAQQDAPGAGGVDDQDMARHGFVPSLGFAHPPPLGLSAAIVKERFPDARGGMTT
jgi:hypothetical protein